MSALPFANRFRGPDVKGDWAGSIGSPFNESDTMSHFKHWHQVLAGALAMGTILSGVLAPAALAQSGRQRLPADEITYVLTAAAWGEAQEAAIGAAGGSVRTRHASGVAIVTSESTDFLARVMSSGAFTGGGHSFAFTAPSGDVVSSTAEAASGPMLDAVLPGDEFLINMQWSLTAIGASTAWAGGWDGTGVRVAVIDGGIYPAHADLDANLDLAASRSFVSGRNIGQDNVGFRRACHLAGIIAAEDNALGTVGVAPHATIIVCKVLDNGLGTFDALIEAILYAADPVSEGGGGADIILIGFANPVDPNTPEGDDLKDAFKQAVRHAADRNVLVIGGVGDHGLDLDDRENPIYLPGETPRVIGVSATAPSGFAVGYPNGNADFARPAIYTNFGRKAVDLAGPGGDDSAPFEGVCQIPRVPLGTQTLPCPVFDMVVAPGFVSGSTPVFSWSLGTGAAAAHVAAVAALVRQKYPSIHVNELRAHLLRTAVGGPGNLETVGNDPYIGRGLVHAGNALTVPLEDAAPIAAPGIQSVAAGRVGPALLELAIAPQPVRGTTTFTLVLPEAGRARLEVIDLAGRNIAVVFEGEVSAGRRNVTWNGAGRSGRLPPGAYFASLSVGGARAVRRLVVVGE